MLKTYHLYIPKKWKDMIIQLRIEEKTVAYVCLEDLHHHSSHQEACIQMQMRRVKTQSLKQNILWVATNLENQHQPYCLIVKREFSRLPQEEQVLINQYQEAIFLGHVHQN